MNTNDNRQVDEKAYDVLRDLAYVLSLTKRVSKEIRQGKTARHVEAARAWSTEDTPVTIAV